MRSCRWSLLPVVVLPIWLAACASEPPKPPGVFDLSNGLDRPSLPGGDSSARPQPGALSPPAPGSVGGSVGAPTPGHLGAGFGN